jgi:hypothetical protein
MHGGKVAPPHAISGPPSFSGSETRRSWWIEPAAVFTPSYFTPSYFFTSPKPSLPRCPQEIDAGRLWAGTPAPAIAIDYWQLPATATMRDVILAIRADEACHAHVNHTFSLIKADEPNPFGKHGGAA